MATQYQPQLEWIGAQVPAMRDELLRLAAINSGSANAAGVAAVADRMESLFAPLGARAERLSLPPLRTTADDGSLREQAIGPALRLRQRTDAPLRVFLSGHLDTVFAADHPFQSARMAGDDRVHGPGVADLKGGLLVMWLALSALERSPWRDRIGWEVVLNPDEEIGSEGSAPLFVEGAKRNHFGLVFEPSFPDGHLAGERKGSGNFDVVVHGRAAHAGRDFALGRNAIRAAADVARALDALNGQRGEVTINVGYVHGGGPTNIVPDRCVLKFNVRTTRPEDELWLHEELGRIGREVQQHDGLRLELRGSFTRAPKVTTPAIGRLSDLIADCGRQIGLSLEFRPTGGCCDGNNLAAAGLPNVDNLGVVGGEIHSDREFMRVSSIGERAQLSALLLLRLASGEVTWSR
ncbi:MAG TPA: hydrolase [Candidatus Binatia bacterium]|nr:hydrolase [Candidatus Binatia bacterium]